MEPRISLVTLGVQDLGRATRFYEAMGLKRHLGVSDGISFFQLNGMVLGLWPRGQLADDAGVADTAPGFSGVTLAYNTRSEEEVDAVLAAAEAAGGRIVKPAQRVFWGGWSGYFADTEGHLWEVAYNADFQLDAEGNISLP